MMQGKPSLLPAAPKASGRKAIQLGDVPGVGLGGKGPNTSARIAATAAAPVKQKVHSPDYVLMHSEGVHYIRRSVRIKDATGAD